RTPTEEETPACRKTLHLSCRTTSKSHPTHSTPTVAHRPQLRGGHRRQEGARHRAGEEAEWSRLYSGPPGRVVPTAGRDHRAQRRPGNVLGSTGHRPRYSRRIRHGDDVHLHQPGRRSLLMAGQIAEPGWPPTRMAPFGAGSGRDGDEALDPRQSQYVARRVRHLRGELHHTRAGVAEGHLLPQAAGDRLQGAAGAEPRPPGPDAPARGGVMPPLERWPYREIWLADFEFLAGAGERPVPVCLCARELRSGREIRIWRDEFGPLPPYPTGVDS